MLINFFSKEKKKKITKDFFFLSFFKSIFRHQIIKSPYSQMVVMLLVSVLKTERQSYSLCFCVKPKKMDG